MCCIIQHYISDFHYLDLIVSRLLCSLANNRNRKPLVVVVFNLVLKKYCTKNTIKINLHRDL